MADVIRADGLTKRYGKVQALDGLDLAVPQGTVLGLLGPNGSGKTTAVSILTTLIDADEGTATVAGADVRTEPAEVRKRIGLSGQYAAVDEVLTGYENLEMIGRLYRMPKRRARERARALLDRFTLADAADRPVKTYSGGMRRRLDLAGAIIAEPPVLFLDEPTTGLDPRSRTDLWEVIRDLVGLGTTLLLTTQYLEEADQLADDILVIDHGRAIAHGTAEELKRQVGGERIEVTVKDAEQVPAASEVLAGFAVGDLGTEGRTLVAPIRGGAQVLRAVLDRLAADGIDIGDVGLRLPTLDEVFLSLTGHQADDGSTGDGSTGDGAEPVRPIVAGDGAGDADDTDAEVTR
jgi:ABC-2 type transport system ATP-binding protein